MNETMKKHIVNSLAKTTKIEGLDSNHLILVTAAGIICGNPSSSSPLTREEVTSKDGPISNSDVAKLYVSFLTAAKETYDGDVSGNDGYLFLENAFIQTPNGTQNLGNIVVFYDQIIGVSIGNLSIDS